MTGKTLSFFVSVASAIFIVVFAVTSYSWVKSHLASISPQDTRQVPFLISQSQSATSVIESLASAKLIQSPLAAKLYLKFTGLDQKIRPGAYSLSPSQSAIDIFQLLSQGPQDIRITIPEGWRREQIALRISRDLPGVDPREFVLQTATLEGQLFPDTYRFAPGSTASDVIRVMSENFRRKSSLSLPEQQDLLIIASLVEREAKLAVDRPLIAAIMLKRLKNHWPLQIDASVQYARDSAKCQRLTTNCQFWEPVIDTKLPSVFNTYSNIGLPPHPIANPGQAAIQSVLSPKESPHWYYLTGNDGTTYYAKTLSEHNLNVDKCLRP